MCGIIAIISNLYIRYKSANITINDNKSYIDVI